MTKTVAVFAGSRDGASTTFNKHAFELGERLAQKSHTVLWGGGQNGAMGALSNGVASKNGVMKAYIAQAYYNPDEIFPAHIISAQACSDDAQRNNIFMQADFQIALVGGVGTFLEIIHAINHKVYHDKTSTPLVIVSADDFYSDLKSLLSKLVEEEFNDPSIKNRYKFVSTPDDAIQTLGLN